MNPELQAAIEASKLLNDEQKQRFLAAGDSLTPEQVKEALLLLQEATQKHETALTEHAQKEKAINAEYIQKIKRAIPTAMKKIETTDREQEADNLESVLSELDNI